MGRDVASVHEADDVPSVDVLGAPVDRLELPVLLKLAETDLVAGGEEVRGGDLDVFGGGAEAVAVSAKGVKENEDRGRMEEESEGGKRRGR